MWKIREDSVRLLISCFVIVATSFLLANCAGKNFERPSLESFTLGKTTRQDVATKMGKPLRSGTFAKNGATLQFDRYAYASTGGAALYRGVTAGRTQEFFYAGDVLVGLDFLSSFKEDGTDFDDSKISQIQKGHSTKLDVVRLLGNPSGEYIYPLVPQRGDRGLVYAYSQVAGSAFNIKISQKVLIVSYDASGTVTNVDYTATGEKD